MKPKILAFSGSLKRDSLNHKLVSIASEGAKRNGAIVTIVHLADKPLPLFNEDLEAIERPKEADEWRELFLEHNGLLIGSPEYNGSITGALKNLIDWMTRKNANSEPLDCFKNKTAAILSGSPGNLGGIRALPHLSEILMSIGVTMHPNRLAIPHATQKINEIDNHPELLKTLDLLGYNLSKSIQERL